MRDFVDPGWTRRGLLRLYIEIYIYILRVKCGKDLSVADEFVSAYCAIWLRTMAEAGCVRKRGKSFDCCRHETKVRAVCSFNCSFNKAILCGKFYCACN